MTQGNRRLFVLLLFILTVLNGHAQKFARKAMLEPAYATGFYQIAVSPELTSAAKSDLSDLRIMDGKQRQVPYLIRHVSMDLSRTTFTEYPVLDIHTDSTRTVVELAVKGGEGTDKISLVMGNTAVERFTSLSGSNDRRQWFIIQEHILLRSMGSDGSGSFVQSVYFPYSRYPYLKLVIYNGYSDPLNILNAGIYRDAKGAEPVNWITNPLPSIVQKDSSNGYTYVHINHNAPYLLDRLLFQISSPRFYNRRVQLFELIDKGNRTLLADAALSSAAEPVITLARVKAKSLLLQIENGDNPPLAIASVRSVQVPQYIVAYLEKGEVYHLLAGNPDAPLPQYDLTQFKDSIPSKIVTLSYGPLLAVAQEERNVFWQESRFWLWPAIVVMVLVLGLLTHRLLSDMQREEG
jgi:hypothetical protein